MCHQDIYQNWSHTGMARMLRPYAPENVFGDFAQNNVFYLGDEVIEDGEGYKFIPGKDRQPFARMIVDRGRHYFEIKQSDRSWHRYPVNYTIGSKWQQGYVTRLPNGQLQVFPIEYNARYRKWVNFWKIIDAPGTERDDPLLWEKFSPATNYMMNCAVCHTSQLRNTKGGGFQPESLEFREPGIDCEMCHGPGGKHVAAHMKGEAYEKDPLQPPVDFTRISSAESVAICSQCHMQSAIRAPGPGGELNYSRGGDGFFERYKSRPYAEFFLKAHFKDGRFRQTSFIAESFLRSKCFRMGGATCVSCHDPHHDDAASNPTSLRFLSEPNRMCTQCHAEFKDAENLHRHTRHPMNSEGSQCASCHMPRIMYALMSQARTHRIDDIPNAQLTEQFGQPQSPNACLICHGDKSIAWLDQQLEVGWNIHTAPSPISALGSSR
jgi:predicted CXXCH cytochrome family protein